MARLPIPLDERAPRPPEAGRIKLGEKYVAANGKTSMRAIDQFRLTSPDKGTLEAAARIWGGTVRAWHDDKARPKDQFELYTETSVLRVWLQPGSLSITYEKWGGKGFAERRCDGRTVSVPRVQGTGFDAEKVWDTMPCICVATRKMACKPKLRLNLILPDIPLGGVWRLETGSEYALDEMRAMADVIEQFQARGLVECELVISKRTTMGEDHNGRPKVNHFVVPVLRIPHTAQALMEGGAGPRAQSLDAPVFIPPALPIATGDDDDEVVDAELVEEVLTEDAARALAAAYARTVDGRNLMLAPTDVYDQVLAVLKVDPRTPWRELAEDLQTRALRGLRGLVSGELRMIDVDGVLKVVQA